MEWLLAALAVVVIGVAACATTGWLGELPDLVDDRVGPELGPGPVTQDDLEQVEFAVVARGYSMEQVDELLVQVAEQLPAGTRSVTEPETGARADDQNVED
ncbi:MAG: DivIVA domain-containing protein [Actinomycetia bacterium]|nr:DivIVA domain-containing protein [Actinomycetes bacterium]